MGNAVLDGVAQERETIARIRARLAQRERTLVEIERLGHLLDAEPGDVQAEPETRELPASTAAERARVRAELADRRAAREQRQAAPRRPPDPNALREWDERILQFIREHEPVRFGQLHRSPELGLERATILRSLERLMERSLVQRTGERAGTRYNLTETLDRRTAEAAGLRGKTHSERRLATVQIKQTKAGVLRALSGGELLAEPTLAGILGQDREHVALACGELLEEGLVELQPDGTYRVTARQLLSV